MPFRISGLSIALLALAATEALAQDSPAPAAAPAAPAAPAGPVWEEVDPIPIRFPRITDANGCRWGLTRLGSLELSGSPAQPTLSLFKHAARLTVAGAVFDPSKAMMAPDGSRIRLTGIVADYDVFRDIWIDRERGGVRWADTVTDRRNEARPCLITLTTVFDQPVPAIHKADGAALPDDASEAGEGALAFLQNQPEGMSSALCVLADPKSPAPARWKGRRNAESQTFEWTVDVPAKGSSTIVTWIVQRPTLAPGDVKEALAPFVRNGRLLRPNLERAAIDSLANFPVRGLVENDATAGEGDPGNVLTALDQFVDSLGVSRAETDIYYMNAKSVLEGTATGGQVSLESRFGTVTVPLDQVAAVQGGGGRGRWPKIFLRDGHVLTGALRLPEWKISGARGWAITLNPDTLEALVLHASQSDGATEVAPQFLAHLTSGETLPIQLAPEARLAFVTPWGPLETPVSEITGLWRVRQPAPATLLSLRDGTRLTVLPAPGELAATSARLGAVTLQATTLAALWPPGSEPPDAEEGPQEITSLDDLPPGTSPRALLRGSAILAATLAEPSITLVNGGTETQLSTEDVTTLARAEGSTDAIPTFTVTLGSGATFEGSLRGGTLALKPGAGAVWSVPLSHFLGWKHSPSAAR